MRKSSPANVISSTLRIVTLSSMASRVVATGGSPLRWIEQPDRVVRLAWARFEAGRGGADHPAGAPALSTNMGENGRAPADFAGRAALRLPTSNHYLLDGRAFAGQNWRVG